MYIWTYLRMFTWWEWNNFLFLSAQQSIYHSSLLSLSPLISGMRAYCSLPLLYRALIESDEKGKMRLMQNWKQLTNKCFSQKQKSMCTLSMFSESKKKTNSKITKQHNVTERYTINWICFTYLIVLHFVSGYMYIHTINKHISLSDRRVLLFFLSLFCSIYFIVLRRITIWFGILFLCLVHSFIVCYLFASPSDAIISVDLANQHETSVIINSIVW